MLPNRQHNRHTIGKPNLYYFPIPRVVPTYIHHDPRQFDNPLTKPSETRIIKNEYIANQSTD